MGSSISTASNTLGTFLGNVFTAPIKATFGRSCEGICAGTWDVACFIEHLCLSSLVKMVMVFALCFICFVFFYLILRVGICQCITKSLCKMCCAACQTCWYVYEVITCFLWQKLTSVERVRRRRRDMEMGNSSSSESDHYSSDDYIDQSVMRRGRKRKEMLISFPRHGSTKLRHMDRPNRVMRSTSSSRRLRTQYGRRSRRNNQYYKKKATPFKKRRLR